MLPSTFEWWYENVSDILTEQEAKKLSQETLNDISLFIDDEDYKYRTVIHLRGKCRALSFPVLYHKFDRLVKFHRHDLNINKHSIIEDISERTDDLKENFCP
ncbi:MAG: hypothetical protein NE334_13605 [Lentisphaeraceae bacterium]|nr:hypothetical protein [Lentisphaeraceae bacterium]